MSKRSIFVVGQGFVGGSLSIGMCHAFDVLTFDKSGKVANADGRGLIEAAHRSTLSDQYYTGPGTQQGGPGVLEYVIEHVEKHVKSFTKVYFVAVPTPMRKDGSADLRIVESVLDQLASVPGDRIAVVKSTVPPGSTESWNKKYENTGFRVVFNPEFLREATAIEDFLNQDRIILGGSSSDTKVVNSLFNEAFPNVRIEETDSTTAELVKYVTNTFLALKVSFANEIYDVCTNAQISYEKLIELATLDPRLGTSHWKVPGDMLADDNSGRKLRGFAGSCFIKDINALIYWMNEHNVDPIMLKAAWEKNLKVRPERDWEHLLGRAVSNETTE